MTVSGMFLPFEQVDTNGDLDPGVLLSAQTITSETTSTTTTTHITKVRIHLWFSDTPQSVCLSAGLLQNLKHFIIPWMYI